MNESATAKQWWTTRDVATYLEMTVAAARMWMWRNNVRRSKTMKTRTCKEWVDAALARKS